MATQNELKIDSSHCRAICDEIGDRLRAMLDRESRRCRSFAVCSWIDLAEQDFGPGAIDRALHGRHGMAAETGTGPMVSMHAA